MLRSKVECGPGTQDVSQDVPTNFLSGVQGIMRQSGKSYQLHCDVQEVCKKVPVYNICGLVLVFHDIVLHLLQLKKFSSIRRFLDSTYKVLQKQEEDYGRSPTLRNHPLDGIFHFVTAKIIKA